MPNALDRATGIAPFAFDSLGINRVNHNSATIHFNYIGLSWMEVIAAYFTELNDFAVIYKLRFCNLA